MREEIAEHALHLDMDQNPFFLAVAQPDPNQFINYATTQVGLTHDLLQLLIEGLVAAQPVDFGVGVGEEECQEQLEVTVQRLLPGTVVVGHRISPFLDSWHDLRSFALRVPFALPK